MRKMKGLKESEEASKVSRLASLSSSDEIFGTLPFVGTTHLETGVMSRPLFQSHVALHSENPVLRCMWRFSESSLETPHASCMGCSPFVTPYTLLHKLSSIYTTQFVVGRPK